MTACRQSAAPITVVAALSTSGGRLFLARRAPGRQDAGKWELPGGKAEPGEKLFEALVRELMEELETSPCKESVPSFYAMWRGGLEYRFAVFPVVFTSDPMPGDSHDAVAWVPWDRIEEYSLAPFDAEPVQDWVSGRYSGACVVRNPRF